MKTIIYYYTGTGNSLWSARQLAERLGNAELRPLQLPDRPKDSKTDAIGLVFPVHMWGVPGPVVDFVQRLSLPPETYLFALAVNAGQVSRTLLQLRRLLAKRGLKLAAGFDVILPSNYIPWGGPGPVEKINARIATAREKITAAAAFISGRQAGRVEKGPLWQRIVFTLLYRISFKQVHWMDKNFWSDERCDSCGVCVRVCPAKNIALESGRPVWNHQCEQCLACIQWCPKTSIQYGKKTPGYERYHHPEVKLKDIIA